MIDNFTTKDKYTFKLYPEIKETVILDALIGEFLARYSKVNSFNSNRQF